MTSTISLGTATSLSLLNNAIQTADGETTVGTYVITLTSGTISLSGTALEAINLKAGVTLDIVGGTGSVLNGGSTEAGLFVYAGTVDLQNITIENMLAKGGAADSGGGGGAGLGGGLFIGSNVSNDAGNVTLNNVTFTNDKAAGGNALAAQFPGGGGGGLNGGAGGAYSTSGSGGGGGGGIGPSAKGGTGGTTSGGGSGGTGIVPHALGGGTTYGGASGGGGGAPNSSGGGGGGVGGHANSGNAGGSGGYGGGGGGGALGGPGAAGGFGGGGGGGGQTRGGGGGFGGGGGGTPNGIAGWGGWGGGNASVATKGGGGLGAGGDIFVQSGASLTITGGGTLSGGSVAGGTGSTNGQAFGSGIYLQGTSAALNFALTTNETISDVITDDLGAKNAASYAGAAGYTAGTVGLSVSGAGTLFLNAHNTYTGTTTINGGVLVEQVAQSTTGAIDINGGTLAIATAASAGTGTIVFAASGSRLDINTLFGGDFVNTLNNLGTIGKVDLQNVSFTSGATAVATGGTLTLVDGATTDRFTLTGTYQNGYYAVADGTGGTLIQSTPCYARGTRILTDRGEIAVEALSVGDQVITEAGEARPITWIGHRALDCRRHPQPESVWPIRVAAHAFGLNLPHRDLFVSPEHALFVEDFLIPARILLNGITVAQMPTDRVEYFHIELATHDVILAEGLPAESYLDTGNRIAFVNGGNSLHLHPRFGRNVHNALACAPFADTGRVVERTRAHLLARAEAQGFARAKGDWHIEADGIALSRDADGAHTLPTGTRLVRILSDAWRPAEMDAAATDTRRLGLCLSWLSLDGTVIPLDHPMLATGFHGVETDGTGQWRWTDGAATLELGNAAARRLEMTIAAQPRAWRRAA